MAGRHNRLRCNLSEERLGNYTRQVKPVFAVNGPLETINGLGFFLLIASKLL